MPTYEYACKECGQHTEAVQSFTDNPLTDCPSCGGPLRKVFGNIGISFKGSGFYKNDSRSSTKSSATSSPGDGASSGTGDTAAAKTESGASSDSGTTKTADSSSGSGASESSKPAAAAS